MLNSYSTSKEETVSSPETEKERTTTPPKIEEEKTSRPVRKRKRVDYKEGASSYEIGMEPLELLN